MTLFNLPDPDHVGASEYRAIHDTIVDALDSLDDKSPTAQLAHARGMLDQFVDHATDMRTRLTDWLSPGTIVTPISARGDEDIVGIVRTSSATEGYVEVLWLSSTRGAFLCEEAASDLTVSFLTERREISDRRIDHQALARVIYHHITAEMTLRDGEDRCRTCHEPIEWITDEGGRWSHVDHAGEALHSEHHADPEGR